MRVKLASLTVAMGLISGCATTAVSEFSSPDGTKTKSVKCVSDVQKCFVAASASCASAGTYKVLSSESHAGGLVADVMVGPFTWYGMTYVCGTSDGRMPEFKFQGQVYVPPPPPPPPPPTQTIKIENSGGNGGGMKTTNCMPMPGGGMNCQTY